MNQGKGSHQTAAPRTTAQEVSELGRLQGSDGTTGGTGEPGLGGTGLTGGIILQAVSGSKAGLCNTVIGQFAQQQSTGAAVNCGLWSGLDTFGQVLTWLGGIGAVGLPLLFGLTLPSKLR